MKLKIRFFLLMGCVFLLFAGLAWYSFGNMVSEINQQWARQFAERQVMFDKHRTLAPLIREIRLARQMAAEPALLELALHEDDDAVRQRAFKVMEQYRFNFRDHSYFAAIAKSGNYYFNDKIGKSTENPYRYTLSAAEKNDQWFYATLRDGTDYQVNLDPDTHLVSYRLNDLK